MNITQDKHFQSFISYIRFEKRFSAHSVTAYFNDLLQFYVFLKTDFEIEDITEVQHPFIRSWIAGMMETEITPRSINRKIATLRAYFRFLVKQGVFQQSPMTKIVAPKTSKRLPVYVDEARMDKLFDENAFEKGFEGDRDRMIIELFYATGMRLSELIGLKLDSLDLNKCQVKVLGKETKKESFRLLMSFATRFVILSM